MPNEFVERMKRQAARDRADSFKLRTKAFENVVADMRAVSGIRFPPGHCWPPAADGREVHPIVGHADGTFTEGGFPLTVEKGAPETLLRNHPQEAEP